MVRKLDLTNYIISTTFPVNLLECTRQIGQTHRIGFIDYWMQLFVLKQTRAKNQKIYSCLERESTGAKPYNCLNVQSIKVTTTL